MRLDDWRGARLDEIAPCYAAERARWRSTLCWDTTTTWQTVEAARRAGALPGFVLRDQAGAIRGWSFHLLHRGELQLGSLVAPSPRATEGLLEALFQSVEARSAARWMVFGWFDAPGVGSLLESRGMCVERYRYLYRDLPHDADGMKADSHGLRPWRPADDAGLARLLSSAYHVADSARPFAANGTMDEWTEYASHLLHRTACGAFDPGISCVSMGGDAVEGAAVMTRLMPTTAHLAQLAVRREAQGRGLGERLLIAALAAAAAANCERVTLLVRETNAAARRLYARHGFSERAQFVSASSSASYQLSAVS